MPTGLLRGAYEGREGEGKRVKLEQGRRLAKTGPDSQLTFGCDGRVKLQTSPTASSLPSKNLPDLHQTQEHLAKVAWRRP